MPAVSPTVRRTVYRVLLVLLCCAAFGRGAALMWHEPMLGLGNNYDMIRVQGCIDAYPVRPATVPPWSNSWQGPISRYQFRNDVDPGCFLTSEALFAFAALPLLRAFTAQSDDGSFPLRAVGWLKLVSLWLAGAGLSLALWRQQRLPAALGNLGLCVALLLDPGVTVYVNGFYAEFAVVLFAYAAVGGVFVALGSTRPSRAALFALAAAVVLVGFSKIQHAVFGLFLLGSLCAALWLTRAPAPRGLLFAVGLAAALAAIGQWLHIHHAAQTESMRRANLTNTVLGAVLASADDPRQTARRLGLPADCGDYAGQTWFTPGLREQHPCPELFELSRLRLLELVVQEPTTVVRLLAGGLERARPWIPQLLGKVEGSVSAPLPAQFFTWDRWLRRLPDQVFAALFLLPPLLAALVVVARKRLRLSPAGVFLWLFCAVYPWFALPGVVFGDGFADTAKQLHLGTTALLAFWLLAAGGLAWQLCNWFAATHRATAPPPLSPAH